MKTLPNHVTLIGAGIMSATLAILLKELEPNIGITIYERLDQVADESSAAMNNAGTGHSAYCELNYTPQLDDGNVDISKAIKIAASYQMSKSLWSYMASKQYIPTDFIHTMPHISFVWGADDVAFLEKRYETMKHHPFFSEMQYSTQWEKLTEWMPLVMLNRDKTIPVAATKVPLGTDVNFGSLTQYLLKHLLKLPNVQLLTQHEVRDIAKQTNGTWHIKVKDMVADSTIHAVSDYIYIGAGGGTLPILDKGNIAEAEGFGGFPVSGQWLVCTNEAVVAAHHAKVYGKATVDAPPMSVPHLDTRIIDGKQHLLFGPFAGFSTKFLKQGSYFDLPLSIDIHNIIPMLSAGWHNLSLTKYLIQQVSLSHTQRMDYLREYLPTAIDDEWVLEQAGQRVQVIKKDAEQGGVLEFGTEIITTADGTLSALLGASPGASTAVYIMVQILKKCFATQMQSPQWQAKLLEIIPMLHTDYNNHYDQWLQWNTDSNTGLGIR